MNRLGREESVLDVERWLYIEVCGADDTGGKDFCPWVFPELHVYEDEED